MTRLRYAPRPYSSALADEISRTVACPQRLLTARLHESCAACGADVHGQPILWARGRAAKHVRCPK